MKKIPSPIDNPARKWILATSFYLVIRGTGPDMGLQSTKIKDKYWVGDADVSYLDNSGKKLPEGEIVICHVFKMFGKYPAIQNWGFLDDIEKNSAQEAVFIWGRWFFLEKRN